MLHVPHDTAGYGICSCLVGDQYIGIEYVASQIKVSILCPNNSFCNKMYSYLSIAQAVQIVM